MRTLAKGERNGNETCVRLCVRVSSIHTQGPNTTECVQSEKERERKSVDRGGKVPTGQKGQTGPNCPSVSHFSPDSQTQTDQRKLKDTL